jgi:hypothetical protein
MELLNKKSKLAVLILLAILVVLTLTTSFHEETDLGDYLGVAKYFSGDYAAKLRPSHSISYGLLLSPFTSISDNLFFVRLINLTWLLLLILSVYVITEKDSKALFLFIFSPIVWYVAPYISPIQLASLLFLWGYYFLLKYKKEEKRYLLISGTIIGFATIFWNSALFIIPILILCFFFNKKLSHVLIFLIGLCLGFIPLMITDLYFYKIPFYSFLKFIVATLAFPLFGGIYGHGVSKSLFEYIPLLLMFPFYFYLLFKRECFKENKSEVIFITLSYLFILQNPQARYLIFLWPILIIRLSRVINRKQFIKQCAMFAFISLIVVSPYVVQIKYQMYPPEWSGIIKNVNNISINTSSQPSLALSLTEITKKYPQEIFVVGNDADDYNILALAYWGKDLKEFVSIQDYLFWKENKTDIWNKKFMPATRLYERRQIWISGGVSKNTNDLTDYKKIRYGIGLGKPLELSNFTFFERYGDLYISKTSSYSEF